jgi:hypothetical protein
MFSLKIEGYVVVQAFIVGRLDRRAIYRIVEAAGTHSIPYSFKKGYRRR